MFRPMIKDLDLMMLMSTETQEMQNEIIPKNPKFKIKGLNDDEAYSEGQEDEKNNLDANERPFFALKTISEVYASQETNNC